MGNGDALVARPARQRPWGLERVGPPVPAGAVPAPSASCPATLPASATATLKLALLPHLMATVQVQEIFAIYKARRRPPEQDVAAAVTPQNFRNLPRTSRGRENSRYPRRVRVSSRRRRSTGFLGSKRRVEVLTYVRGHHELARLG